MTKSHIKGTLAIAVFLSISPAWSQDQGMTSSPDMSSMPGMDHGTMPGMDHQHMSGDAPPPDSGMNGMDHGTMEHGNMNHDSMSHDNMDHGSMPMPDKPATGLRDPNAYSDGYTLDSGAYALPGPRQLRLADEHNFSALLVNRLERVYTSDNNATTYDAQAWFGRDYDRVVIKAEGDAAKGKLQDARTELLWGHAIASFWDTQLGVRHDGGAGPNRSWLALGVQGVAPYWFEIEATMYAGDNGRTALRLGAEYELLLTQKLILQPRAEINLYDKSDPERDIGSGLSDVLSGLRLRYEFTRQFAPYAGIEWAGKLDKTADFARAAGAKISETRWVAGVRFWF